MASESKRAGGGIGFLGGLALLFIGLKLGGVIHWHWAYVLLPLWGPLAAFLAILAMIAVVLLVALLADLLIYYCAPRAATGAEDDDEDDDA